MVSQISTIDEGISHIFLYVREREKSSSITFQVKFGAFILYYLPRFFSKSMLLLKNNGWRKKAGKLQDGVDKCVLG